MTTSLVLQYLISNHLQQQQQISVVIVVEEVVVVVVVVEVVVVVVVVVVEVVVASLSFDGTEDIDSCLYDPRTRSINTNYTCMHVV